MDKKWWTLAAVCTGVFMLLLDLTIVNVALPSIERMFNASLSDLQWVVDAYALTLAALLLTAGSLADMAGRRIVFAIGIVMFTIGSTLCGLAPSATFLALARGLQGVGGAVMFATSLALLAQAFQPMERGVAFGIFGAVTGGAIAIGPVLGGAVTSGLSWRWIFFVNIPIGIGALVVTLTRVEESKLPDARRPDLPGFVCFSLALAGLVFGLIKSQYDGWESSTVLIPLIAAVVLFGIFLTIEICSREPMFDLALLRVPTFNGGLVAGFGVSSSIFSMLTYLTLFLQGILGYSPVQAGIRFLPFTGVIFISAAAAGRLTTKVPTKFLISGGLLLTSVSMFLMGGISSGDTWTHFLPGFIVGGIGYGFVNVPLASTAVGVVSPERAGMASGVNSTARQVGTATGVAALGTILASIIKSRLTSRLAGTSLAAHSHQLALTISSGSVSSAVSHVPASARVTLEVAARASYVDALNTVLLVGAIVAAVATVMTFVMIRTKDFHHVQMAAAEAAPAAI